MSGATVLESFAIAVTGDAAAATPAFTSNTLKVTVRMSSEFVTTATADSTYMAAITSRKVNGNWLRSYAQFDVTEAPHICAGHLDLPRRLGTLPEWQCS